MQNKLIFCMEIGIVLSAQIVLFCSDALLSSLTFQTVLPENILECDSSGKLMNGVTRAYKTHCMDFVDGYKGTQNPLWAIACNTRGYYSQLDGYKLILLKGIHAQTSHLTSWVPRGVLTLQYQMAFDEQVTALAVAHDTIYCAIEKENKSELVIITPKKNGRKKIEKIALSFSVKKIIPGNKRDTLFLLNPEGIVYRCKFKSQALLVQETIALEQKIVAFATDEESKSIYAGVTENKALFWLSTKAGELVWVLQNELFEKGLKEGDLIQKLWIKDENVILQVKEQDSPYFIKINLK